MRRDPRESDWWRPGRRSWRTRGVVAVALLLGLTALVVAPELLHPSLSAADLAGVVDIQRRIELQQAQAQLQDQVRLGLLQGMGGVILVLGALAAWQQVLISRDGHVTQLFTRAIDQLGDSNLDVRIGGIYALERIARASSTDRVTIMFQLGAFVRHHSPWPPDEEVGEEGAASTGVDLTLPWLRTRRPDVQAAMNVLSRRLFDPDLARMYLARTDLRSLQVNDGALLTNANFNYANLARAFMRRVNLDRSSLRHTDLRLAHLGHASLVGADLRNARLEGARLQGANLQRADLRGANLTDADLEGADLTGVIDDETTTWPSRP